MILLDCATWLLPIVECLILVSILRSGRVVLFPGFTVWITATIILRILYQFALWDAALYGYVIISPLAFWASWEAFKQRMRYLDDVSPPWMQKESNLIAFSSLCVGLALVIAVSGYEVQFNLNHKFLAKVRTLWYIFLAVALGMAISYLAIRAWAERRRLKSPLYASKHMLLLFSWFSLFGITNIIPVADDIRWLTLRWFSTGAGLLIAAAWAILFRGSPRGPL